MEFDDLYRTYKSRVFHYLTRLVGEAEAEDLVQDVFLKVRQKLCDLKDESKVSSWIFKIALNCARDRLRSSGVRRVFSIRPYGEEDPLEQIAGPYWTADEVLERRQMIECYLGFVANLPENYHDVYVFSELDGLSDQEIANKLSISVASVKVRMHRARKQLYDALRTHCRCYTNERGELMGIRKPRKSNQHTLSKEQGHS